LLCEKNPKIDFSTKIPTIYYKQIRPPGKGDVSMNEFKKTDNDKNNNGCLKSIFITILIIAVLHILASLVIPYMNLFAINLIIFFTIFTLIVMTLAAILLKPQNQTTPELSKVAIISGFIGIIVVSIFSYRDNAGVNVNWKYFPKPDGSPIEEVLSDQSFVVVKTQSGNRFIARHSLCNEEYCWDDDLSRWMFQEKKAVNDPSCASRSLPKQPPDNQTGEEYIFRRCSERGAVYETRIVVAKDEGLWVWHKIIEPTSYLIHSIFTRGLLAVPAFALIGVLLYKGVNKFRVWMR
jgi:amino acid transporter